MQSDAFCDRSTVNGPDRRRAFPDGAVELIYSLEEKENRNDA